MQNTLCLIADPRGNSLVPAQVTRVIDALAIAGARTGAPRWLKRGAACDIGFERIEQARAEQVARTTLKAIPVDIVALTTATRRKKLLVADMESTIIRNEMLDELAELCGIGSKIADITRRAMNGEIDFEGALKERVGLLKGQPAERIEQAWERMREMPGARALVATMKNHGAHTALVSGGFDVFTGRVRDLMGFDSEQANHLIVEDGVLAGTVREPILGRDAKLETLRRLASAHAGSAADVIAVGDGANDLAMLGEAGLGVAFRAKPKVAAAARIRIDHGDLTALLYLQGYAEDEFVT